MSKNRAFFLFCCVGSTLALAQNPLFDYNIDNQSNGQILNSGKTYSLQQISTTNSSSQQGPDEVDILGGAGMTGQLQNAPWLTVALANKQGSCDDVADKTIRYSSSFSALPSGSRATVCLKVTASGNPKDRNYLAQGWYTAYLQLRSGSVTRVLDFRLTRIPTSYLRLHKADGTPQNDTTVSVDASSVYSVIATVKADKALSPSVDDSNQNPGNSAPVTFTAIDSDTAINLPRWLRYSVTDTNGRSVQIPASTDCIFQLGVDPSNVPANATTLSVDLAVQSTGKYADTATVHVTFANVDKLPMPAPTFRLTKSSLNFSAGSAGQTFDVTSSGRPILFNVSKTKNWLSVNPPAGSTPQTITVTVDSSKITQSQDTDTITISDTANQTPSQSVIVTAGGAVQCTYSFSPPSDSVGSAAGNRSVTLNTQSGCNWSAFSDNTSWLNITSQAQGTGAATISYNFSANSSASRTAHINANGQQFTLTQGSIAPTQTSKSIPRVANGDQLQTTITLVNADTSDASYSLRFWDSGGNSVNIPLDQSSDPLSGIIPLGGSRTIRTLGRADYVVGWAELTSDKNVTGFAVYTQTGQEGTMPLNPTGTSHFILPYDNTGPFTTSMAITNVSAQTAHVSAVIRDNQGNVLDRVNLDPLSPRNHTAFATTGQFTRTKALQGQIEFTSDFDVSAVALRFNGASGAFTAYDILTVPSRPSAPPDATVPRVVDGTGTQTTITLVNTDSLDAPYSVRFWNTDGTPLNFPLDPSSAPLSGTIRQGGIAVLRSSGKDPGNIGWGELLTSNSIAGLAVYLQGVQESTFPLNPAGTQHFLVPFDNTNPFATSMAITNISAQQNSTVHVVVRNVNGTLLEPAQDLKLGPRAHTAFEIRRQFGTTDLTRGVLEFTSDVPLSAVVIRFNNVTGTQTSYRILPLN